LPASLQNAPTPMRATTIATAATTIGVTEIGIVPANDSGIRIGTSVLPRSYTSPVPESNAAQTRCRTLGVHHEVRLLYSGSFVNHGRTCTIFVMESGNMISANGMFEPGLSELCLPRSELKIERTLPFGKPP
jgi:hypothetical protein